MKPSEYDLAELRAEAVQGKIKGKRGTSTNYYSQVKYFWFCIFGFVICLALFILIRNTKSLFKGTP